MKLVLPIILCFIYSLSHAQQHSSACPDAISIPAKKIELRNTYKGEPIIVWREVKMEEPHLISNLTKRLVEEVKKNGLAAYNNPQDSLTQPQAATIKQVLFSEMYPDTVNRILMLEQWDYDEQEGQMVVKIIALAPAYAYADKYYPLFWNRYAALTPSLKEIEYTMGKQVKTMYDVFQRRSFTSHIIKY